MSRMSYENNIKPLVNRMQSQFMGARNAELVVRFQNGNYYVCQLYKNTGCDVLCSGTLREVYYFLKGMSEFLI